MRGISPRSSASFISIASRLSWCRLSSAAPAGAAMPRCCSTMIASDRRETPVKQITIEVSSSFATAGVTRSGLTMTRSPAWNSMKLMPPKVAAYWSCLPPARPRSMRSISKARCATSYGPSGALSSARNASTSATTSAEEEPRPDPAGAST